MEKVFKKIVSETSKYVQDNNLKSLVLGVSGGIDSTVVSAIMYEVSLITNVNITGRSLYIKNKAVELEAADKVGKAFFWDSYKSVDLSGLYENVREFIDQSEKEYTQTPIANGNIQARLRMIYLYNLAGLTGGIVMDTDNLTEHNLGFFTIHGDEGDFNPIGGLWKTEVYKLANYLVEFYKDSDIQRSEAIQASIELIPTDGLGISSSDLEQIGAASYEEVDDILQHELRGEYVKYESTVKVIARHEASRFKRNERPVRIKRETLKIEEKE